MKPRFAGVGADKKKVAILGGLALVLAYVFYSNVLAPADDRPAPRAHSSAPRPAVAAQETYTAPASETRPRPNVRGGAESARPQFKMNPRDQRSDPTTIDPTLRLDLLARVQAVAIEGGTRNLFQFNAAPLPAAPEPKIVPKRRGGPAAVIAASVDQTPAAPPPPPPPPPIPLKFYGYTSQARQTERRAFFLDGDDIVVVSEGQTIKSRYKVVRINLSSVVVEDLQFQNQQTLPLEEAAG
jgi:hypothetical protein